MLGVGIRSLVCGYSEVVRRRMALAMLVGYFDDAGSHLEAPVFVYGGVVAEVPAWETFSDEWAAELEAEPSVAYFSMKVNHYLHAGGHSGTWDHVDAELTIVMFPEVGHFVQHEAAERVTDTMVDWLAR